MHDILHSVAQRLEKVAESDIIRVYKGVNQDGE